MLFNLIIMSYLVSETLVTSTREMTRLEAAETRFLRSVNPYPTTFPYGKGMVLHFYQQQESSTTKTVHKVINKSLKTYVESPHTGENFH